MIKHIVLYTLKEGVDKAEAVGIIKENPYILCDENYGIPFEKADARQCR